MKLGEDEDRLNRENNFVSDSLLRLYSKIETIKKF